MRHGIGQLREDSYSSEELEEAIDVGEVGYCEIDQHYDWAGRIQSYPRLDDPAAEISFCDDCHPRVAAAIVTAAFEAKLDSAEAVRRVHVYVGEGHFDPLIAGMLIQYIESPGKAAAEHMSDEARHERGEFQLGPLLAAEAIRVVAEAREEFGDTIEDDDLDQDWWMDTIDLRLGGLGMLAMLADTPDTLAYQLDFDELYADYSTEGATPGWMIDEAAWRLVRDEARKQLGLPSLYAPREG